MIHYKILILLLLYAVVTISLPIEYSDESSAGLTEGFIYSFFEPRFKPDIYRADA